MNYYFDTEFFEHETGRTTDNKTKVKIIDLISIGITNSLGNRLYLVSKEFNLRKAYANEWIRTNVLTPIYFEMTTGIDLISNIQAYRDWLYHGGNKQMTEARFRHYRGRYGKSAGEIQRQILEFINPVGLNTNAIKHNEILFEKHKFIGYYCAYDWVVLSQLFISMLHMPKDWYAFPFDLVAMYNQLLESKYPTMNPDKSCSLLMRQAKLDYGYDDIHHALSDAIGIWKLHENLEILKP